MPCTTSRRVVSAPMSLQSQRSNVLDGSTDQRIWRPVHYRDITPPASSSDTSSQDHPPSEASGEAAQATAAPTIPPSVGKRERRSSICKSIVVSWPKPGKVAMLGYGNAELAKEVCASFNEPSATGEPRKLLCGHKVTAIMGPEARAKEARADGAPQAPQPTRAACKVMVFFGPLPNITDSALKRLIRTSLKPGPRQVDMVEYKATIEATSMAVKTFVQDVAPVESFSVFDDRTKTRLEAAVCFQDLEGALKAYRQLNNFLLPFFPEGKLRVHLHDVNDRGVRCHKRS